MKFHYILVYNSLHDLDMRQRDCITPNSRTMNRWVDMDIDIDVHAVHIYT